MLHRNWTMQCYITLQQVHWVILIVEYETTLLRSNANHNTTNFRTTTYSFWSIWSAGSRQRFLPVCVFWTKDYYLWLDAVVTTVLPSIAHTVTCSTKCLENGRFREVLKGSCFQANEHLEGHSSTQYGTSTCYSLAKNECVLTGWTAITLLKQKT